MFGTLPLQAQPELLGSPFDRLLLVLVLVAAVLLVGRILLSIAWKIVVVATILVAVVGVATTFGLV